MIFARFEMIKDAVRSIGHFFRALFCKSVYYCKGRKTKSEIKKDKNNSAFEEYQDEVRKEYEYLHWDIR